MPKSSFKRPGCPDYQMPKDYPDIYRFDLLGGYKELMLYSAAYCYSLIPLIHILTLPKESAAMISVICFAVDESVMALLY